MHHGNHNNDTTSTQLTRSVLAMSRICSAAMADAQTRLVVAACEGDFVAALAALSAGANVHDAGMTVYGSSCWPLAGAAMSGHVALALHLIAHGADVNAPSVMRFAVSACSVGFVQLLLDAGAVVSVEEGPAVMSSVVGYPTPTGTRILGMLLERPTTFDLHSLECGVMAARDRGNGEAEALLSVEVRCSCEGPAQVCVGCNSDLPVLHSHFGCTRSARADCRMCICARLCRL